MYYNQHVGNSSDKSDMVDTTGEHSDSETVVNIWKWEGGLDWGKCKWS